MGQTTTTTTAVTTALLALCVACSLLVATTTARSVAHRQKRAFYSGWPADDEAASEECRGNRQCGWYIYTADMFGDQNPQFFLPSCTCPKGLTCEPDHDNPAISSVVYKCHTKKSSYGRSVKYEVPVEVGSPGEYDEPDTSRVL